VHQRVLVASKVAKKVADVSLNAVDAGDRVRVRALRPAGEGRELAPTSHPATVPQAPLRTLQATNRLVGPDVQRIQARTRTTTCCGRAGSTDLASYLLLALGRQHPKRNLYQQITRRAIA
jgi:hypothetical protein